MLQNGFRSELKAHREFINKHGKTRELAAFEDLAAALRTAYPDAASDKVPVPEEPFAAVYEALAAKVQVRRASIPRFRPLHWR